MKYFSVPADFKHQTIDQYDRLHEMYKDSRVIETYGNITIANDFGSGRSINLLPRVDLDGLADYIAYSSGKDIGFNYTINATHMQNAEFSSKGILEIIHFLGKLYEAGVRSITISLPSLIELVRETGYDFKIVASTLCQITNAVKALAYKKMGVDRIVLDESVNRDFKTLKKIRRAFGPRVEIIANAICHKNCAYRMFHYNQMTTDSIKISSETSVNYYSHRCLMQRYESVGDLFRLSWVRPEDMKYYTETGIDYFKLQGRQAVLKGEPVRAVECYFREDYQGDLFELLDMFDPTSSFRVPIDNKNLDGFIRPFYEKENFCQNDCQNCHYCDSFARKGIDGKKARQVMDSARSFFDEYDQFRKALRSITGRKSEGGGKAVMDTGFDLD
jgi:collagenase-like PrtC family protease